MSDELNPLSGREEVSLNDASVVTTTAAPEPSLLASARKKKAKDRTPEETAAVRAYNNAAKGPSRDRVNARKEKASRKFDSAVEIKPKDAREILAETRGLRNPRVIEVCVELAETAAKGLHLPFSAHLFTHGVQKSLEARELDEEVAPPSIEDVWKPGERIREHELWAIWDYSTSWREQPDGHKISFEEFKRLRRLCMTDVYRFGNELLGMDFHEQPHGQWSRELFVQKNPDLLPEEYDWEDVKKALAAQSEIHQRLLISSRSSYKSSFNLIDLLSWVLVFSGDIRILMVSSTRPLSAGFLKKFRSYWTVKNRNNPTLFQQLWPEHCIAPEEGTSKNFISPMRRLDLIQPTLASSSLDSEGLAGERADLFCAEDLAEISNSSNEEQREKTLEKFDMLRELLEPFGFLQVIGTPFAPGDIYSTMLEREGAAEEKRLLYQINPAWTVKPDVRKEPYDLTLTEDEVDLLFPSRLTFKYLKAKLRENVKVFRQQSLCSWVPDEESQIKLNFDRDLLMKNVVPASAKPHGEVYLVADVAYSTNKYSDNSAIGAVCVHTNQRAEKSLCVLNMEVGKMRSSEFALNIVKMTRAFQPRSIIIEKGPTWDLLQAEILRVAGPTHIPLYWSQPSNKKNAKQLRLKALESCLVSGRLTFVSGMYLDPLFNELERLNGKASSGKKKEDQADCLTLAQKHLLPAVFGEVHEEDERTDKEKEQEARAALNRAHHARMFGDAGGNQFQEIKHQPEPPRTPQQDPRTAQLMKILPPALRGRGQR